MSKIKINLLKLTGAAHLNLLDEKNQTVDCVVIPVKPNNLFITANGSGAYLELSSFNTRSGSTLIKRYLSKEEYNAMSKEERLATPIVGEIEGLPLDVTPGASPAANGQTAPGYTNDPNNVF